MINIKNIDGQVRNIKDTKGVLHNINPGSIITIPRNMLSASHLLQAVESGWFIVFPDNGSNAAKKDDQTIDDRFDLMDFEE